jgi:hypothetical protein
MTNDYSLNNPRSRSLRFVLPTPANAFRSSSASTIMATGLDFRSADRAEVTALTLPPPLEPDLFGVWLIDESRRDV